MAIVGITPGAVRKYTSKLEKDLPENERVIWTLGSVDSLAMARMNDTFLDLALSEDGKEGKVQNLRMFEWATELCKYGLRGWVGFKDGLGNEIEFKTLDIVVSGVKKQVAHPESLGQVPLEVLQELAMEIKGVNTVSEQEAKNSVKA